MAEETDVQTEVVAQESQIPQEPEPSPEPQKEEVNWKKARELMEDQKRQLDLMKERERRYQEELVKLTQKSAPAEEELNLSKDDLLTVDQFEKLSNRRFEQKFQELQRKYDDQSAEVKLRQEFNDYDAIVTPENLERLARENPEAVETLQANTRLYAKAKTAYQMLKSMYGTYQTQENKDKLQANLTKPRAAASTGSNGALSQAHLFEKGLTPELKKQLLQEMVDAKKRS